ncbi:MAG: NVEALA domain-containing protein [Bacteroidales bacterium]|nr:NVEALA domain-containing protein [Bacteroidales bacterium]
MNKKVGLIILLFIASCSIGIRLNRENDQADLTLAVIEALADSENDNTECVLVGSVDCPKSKEKVLYYY